jgi:hypothetical protein
MDGVRAPGGGLLRALRTDLNLAISLFNKEEGGMTEKTLPVRGKVSFEEVKRVNDHGAEYQGNGDRSRIHI